LGSRDFELSFDDFRSFSSLFPFLHFSHFSLGSGRVQGGLGDAGSLGGSAGATLSHPAVLSLLPSSPPLPLPLHPSTTGEDAHSPGRIQYTSSTVIPGLFSSFCGDHTSAIRSVCALFPSSPSLPPSIGRSGGGGGRGIQAVIVVHFWIEVRSAENGALSSLPSSPRVLLLRIAQSPRRFPPLFLHTKYCC
jgi:hypothetical protein